MGIQRLGLRMKDYATKVTLGSTELFPAKRSSIAIIDGPGLAHYIYYGLCDSSSSTITYEHCVNATIDWLDRLQTYGFSIEAVLFDGALPASKKDVRIDRLQNYIARLLAFKQSSGTSLASLNGQTKKSLPPPPFLVFAIVEELVRNSKYAGVTYVVPGEADPFCVAAAQAIPKDKDIPIAIFSDDSDLLVYEVDVRVRIVPFRDLTESQVGTSKVLQGEEYRPAEIAKRGKQSNVNLVQAAYFMSLDYHCSLEKAFRLIASSELSLREEYKTFAGLFETQREVQELSTIRANRDISTALASRDSRVSELIYQLQSASDGNLDGALRMYLPFLSDDPSRTTAWAVGADVRLLGYSLLLAPNGCDTSVQEYRRSGTRIASSLLEVLAQDRLSGMLQQVRADLETAASVSASEARLSAEDAWRYLVVGQVLRHVLNEGLQMPAVDDIVNTVMNREARKWHLIHLAAQYQAAFYSVRLLKQISAYVVAQTLESVVAGELILLHDQLNSMPRVSAFFDDKAGSNRRVEQEAWRSVLPGLISQLDAANGASPSGTKKSAKSRKRAKKSHSTQPEDSNLAKNPFAMLVD